MTEGPIAIGATNDAQRYLFAMVNSMKPGEVVRFDGRIIALRFRM